MSRKKSFFRLLRHAICGRIFSEEDVRSCKKRVTDYRALAEEKERLETIFLGASHAKYGIYPNAFSSFVFNAGEVSADLYTSYHLGRLLLERYPSIQTVVLIYSFFNAGFDLSKTSDNYLCALYSNFLGVPWRKIPFPFQLGLRFLKHNIYPKREPNPKGWTAPTSFFPEDASVEARVEGHWRLFTCYGKAPLQYLYALQELCSQKGKRLVVVVSPMRSDYRQKLKRLMDKTKINLYEDLENKKNCFELIHAEDWLTDEYFGDFDHLNQKGAIEFSKRLNKLLE